MCECLPASSSSAERVCASVCLHQAFHALQVLKASVPMFARIKLWVGLRASSACKSLRESSSNYVLLASSAERVHAHGLTFITSQADIFPPEHNSNILQVPAEAFSDTCHPAPWPGSSTCSGTTPESWTPCTRSSVT
jgi:hypothetical protein